jgi:ABC-type uncharacterized transport system substrate-binding protein
MIAKALTLAGALLLAGALEVQAEEAYIAIGEDLRGGKERLINKLREELTNNTGYKLPFISSTEAAALNTDEDTVITLGEKGLRIVMSGEGKSKIVAAFISSESFNRVLADFPQSSRSLTAVYSDPDPMKQLALAVALYGENVVVGFLTSDLEGKLSKSYESAAKRLGIKTHFQVINDERSAKRVFDSLGDTNVIVLAKDKAMLEEVGLEKFLYLAYDINNIGVIGYSSGLVKNGAIGTTYASIEDTAQSISEIISTKKIGDKIPEPKFTKSFSIALNKYVMRSLLIPEIDEEKVEKEVRNMTDGGVE